jgi:hypothetical protein
MSLVRTKGTLGIRSVPFGFKTSAVATYWFCLCSSETAPECNAIDDSPGSTRSVISSPDQYPEPIASWSGSASPSTFNMECDWDRHTRFPSTRVVGQHDSVRQPNEYADWAKYQPFFH